MISLATYGRPVGFTRPLVARVARNPEPDANRQAVAALVTERNPFKWEGFKNYRAIVTSLPLSSLSSDGALPKVPTIHSAKSVEHLRSGDVIVLTPQSGRVRTIFRPDSSHNFLFATERCNSFCLMCSQPPIDRDDSEQVEINLEAIRLMEPSPVQLGITGGEPTLLGHGLFELMAELKARLPKTNIHMLTNGRRFAWPDFTQAFMTAAHPRLTLGIPVYADNAPVHDYVVQALCRHNANECRGEKHRLSNTKAGVPAEWFSDVKVIGPLATFDGTDNWVNHPYRAGVALIGDAAGSSDPSYGQGQSQAVRDARLLRDQLLANQDWDAAGHAYADQHDRYFAAVRLATGWICKLFYTPGPEAGAMRARAFPRLAEDGSRMPDLLISGPEVPLDESVRLRFFGED